MTSQHIGDGGNAVLRSYGWPIVEIDGREALLTTEGICGVSVPKPLGERVRERLAIVDSCGPIVGHHRPLPRYVLLAESDSFIAPAEFARRGPHCCRPRLQSCFRRYRVGMDHPTG